MRTARLAGLIALVVLSIAFPRVMTNPAVIRIAILTLLYATATTAWNIFAGYTGYIALGHAAFFGVGSYAMALMCQDWHIPGGYLPFLLLPLTGLIAAVFAIPLGWVSLRTRRHTFVVITIATFFIMQLMAFNLREITNGSIGISLPIPSGWKPEFFNLPFYYVALVMLFVTVAVAWWIRNSKFGLGLLAIRDDEDRALGLGVKTGSFKLTAFVISAFFVGMVGAVHAYYIASIYPAFAFDPLFDLAVALMAFLGGIGTLFGPLVGAIILEPTQQLFTIVFSQKGLYLVVYGALFLTIILAMPEGIIPTLRKYWDKWGASRGGLDEGASTTGTGSPKDQAASQPAGEHHEAKL
jgi:ABC-type branched-subunit amino acid transport system permease subunit